MAKPGRLLIGGTVERMHNFFPVTLGMCQSKHLRSVTEQVQYGGNSHQIKKQNTCCNSWIYNFITHSERSQRETNATDAVGCYQAF